MASEEVIGTVALIRARVQCGGCGIWWEVQLDSAREFPAGWSIYDEVIDIVRGSSLESGTSVQGGYMLCEDCTKKVDADPRVPEDQPSTAADVERVLKIIDADADEHEDETEYDAVDDEEDDDDAT